MAPSTRKAGLSFKLGVLEGMLDKLDCQAIGQELGLPVGADVLPAILPGIKLLKERVALRDVIIDAQDIELKRLRPPEPKFRVGQVVGWGHTYHRVLARQANGITPSKWEYELLGVGWRLEENLSALKESEK